MAGRVERRKQKMRVLAGVLLGLAAGMATWVVAGWFGTVTSVRVQRHPSEPEAEALTHRSGERRSTAMSVWIAMALWGGYVGWRSGRLDVTVSATLFTSLLVALSLVDLRTRRLPNGLLLALLAWAIAQSLWLGQPPSRDLGLGLLAGGGLFLIVALARPGALGTGDVKLAAVLGAALGFPLGLLGLLCGAVTGGVAAAVLLLTRRAGRKDTMAYGPYLALGAWLVWSHAQGLLW
jgi:prepilin signal peptidase PulO-like enzyme (type II secretory pathway)